MEQFCDGPHHGAAEEPHSFCTGCYLSHQNRQEWLLYDARLTVGWPLFRLQTAHDEGVALDTNPSKLY